MCQMISKEERTPFMLNWSRRQMFVRHHQSRGLFHGGLKDLHSQDSGKVGATDVHLLHPDYQVGFVDLGQLIIPRVLRRQWRIHIHKNLCSSKNALQMSRSQTVENQLYPGMDLFVFRSSSFTAGLNGISFLLSKQRNLGSSLLWPSGCSLVSDQANVQFNLTCPLKQTSPM